MRAKARHSCLILLLLLAKNKPDRSALEAERFAELVFEVTLIGEMHELFIINEQDKRRRLRALLRASAFGNIAIMFPMIVALEEVLQIKEIVKSVMAELDASGIP